MTDQESDIEIIRRRLNSLEHRLNRLESVLAYREAEDSARSVDQITDAEAVQSEDLADQDERGLESRIGRFGLAWMGNIVLLFGIIFLTQYLAILSHQLSACAIGYFSAASIYFLAEYLKKTNSHLSFMFKMNAQVLLYYVTMRLHFFSAAPLIGNKSITIILLVILTGIQAFISVRGKSQAFALLAVLFSLTTAILADSTVIMLPLILLTSAGGILYFYRFDWRPLLIATVILTYISFILWVTGNPYMGHTLQFITDRNSAILCLFGLGAVYSSILVLRRQDSVSDDFCIGVTFTNGILFTMLAALVVLRFFTTDYVLLFSVITVSCLAYSVILHSKSSWNFGSAFYALYGFMAMSIALYGLFGLPRVYLLLSVQSLLVVSMALWFRNRLIVIMNSLLFLLILSIYLFTSKTVDGVNFSFAAAALVSARVINWKKSRLQIQTDLIRNLYMTEGFFMVLYALGHAIPVHFVTLSWTLAALLYFLLSIILKNVKYRYMALGTMICAAFYLFIVDLARIEIVYRVLALLFLAAISIGISIYYTNRIKKSEKH
jgi:hypothetical protein